MAILIVEHNGTLEGASLSGRILIGRRANNHVVIDHPAVSRIHAWIDTTDRQFCITDAGSRTGTFVNGLRVAGGRLALRHGDRITVGPASLTFRADTSLPAGVSQLNFGDARRGRQRPDPGTPPQPEADGGILFDCPSCRSPLWIAAELRRANRQVPVLRHRAAPAESRGAGTATATAAAVTATRPLPRRRRRPSVRPTPRPVQLQASRPKRAARASRPIGAGRGIHDLPRLRPHVPRRLLGRELRLLGLRVLAGERVAPEEGARRAIRFNPAAGFRRRRRSRWVRPQQADARRQYALLAGSVMGVVLGALTFGVPALLACAAALVYINRLRGAAAADAAGRAGGGAARARRGGGGRRDVVRLVARRRRRRGGNAALPLITTEPEPPGRRDAQP